MAETVYVTSGLRAITEDLLGFTPQQIRLMAGHSGENKIQVIKMMREVYRGLGLAGAKYFVEYCMRGEWENDNEIVKYSYLRKWALAHGHSWND